MWQPDGWARTRIGVLTPQVDLNPESEFRALAGGAVSIHAARVAQKTYDPRETKDRKIASDRVRAFADPPQVDDAAESLATASLHAIAYCFTSSSYMRGAADARHGFRRSLTSRGPTTSEARASMLYRAGRRVCHRISWLFNRTPSSIGFAPRFPNAPRPSSSAGMAFDPLASSKR